MLPEGLSANTKGLVLDSVLFLCGLWEGTKGYCEPKMEYVFEQSGLNM